MKRRNFFNTFLLVFISLVLSFIFILSSFSILVFDFEFYKREFVNQKVYRDFGNSTYVDNLASNLIHYFRSGDLLEGIYGEKEVGHLNDVRNVVKYIPILLYILLAIFAVYIYFFNSKELRVVFAGSSIFISLIVIAIFIFSAFNFAFLFDHFHRLFFTEGSWVLGNGVLIRLFPEGFFINALEYILLYCLIFSFIAFFIGLLIKESNLNVR